MDEPIQTQERAQFAVIGIALILAALMVVALATSTGDAWRWLMLGAPVAMILSATTRLRRIRATRQPD
ncbi:hypothetical protein [Agrococcus jejuensis]|uniref:Uncharacterized protein n=1 Tax=Agrococcus jejuensis TaxID=399736 RepID=A0A1G7ZZQ1_9MICO|nr:hypothetical protein [Agrococcus jejuensis]SDH13640.1 hypothetical protein SAMN04489720_0168 [Agrococcus jejuensis]